MNRTRIFYIFLAFSLQLKATSQVKPKTPFNLTVQYDNKTYRFFWKSGYEDHMYGEFLPFMYELKYYKDGDPTDEVSVQPDRPDQMIQIDEVMFDLGTAYTVMEVKVQPDKEMIQIDEVMFDLGTAYTVMVRTMIDNIQKGYSGTWSEWSNAVKWKTAYGDKDNQVNKIAIGMLSMVGLLILLMCIPFARFKMKEISWVPTPETYFQPLYQNYQGNFQSLNVACLSGDVLLLEHSALSLECLEDCEASEAPVIINPVPSCFKQDYCTLTNTATGPVPTFNRDEEQDENT
ncbi:interleukin 21 receptor, tandem duplicate 2 [Garra rufa]|uniref:interleukin 21 receptor, tandem duplicate 2 n=1 Tax=Garra rufa TaxID=137080 RepID=UPI003CCEB98A